MIDGVRLMRPRQGRCIFCGDTVWTPPTGCACMFKNLDER